MMNETTFEVSWAYGETTFINARDEAHARRVAVGMGRAMALGRVLWVLPAEEVSQPSHKEVAGVCEDAPCCGCCG
jgi:hypothetical protein